MNQLSGFDNEIYGTFQCTACKHVGEVVGDIVWRDITSNTIAQGKIYLFTDGIYRGEYDTTVKAAAAAMDLHDYDVTGHPREEWAQLLMNHNHNSIEIIHEADYRFFQGNNHPANRMELKENYSQFVDAEFVCDDSKRYKGKYIPTTRWNGWACPYFTLEVAFQMLTDFGYAFFHNDERDMIIISGAGMQDGEQLECEGVLFDGVHMYQIGGYNWVWEAVAKRSEPEAKEMDYAAKFPNGLTSWIETHFEMVAEITRLRQMDDENICCLIKEINDTNGTGGFYELAEDWTDEFENENKDRDWADGDFFDSIEDFVKLKRYIADKG